MSEILLTLTEKTELNPDMQAKKTTQNVIVSCKPGRE